MPSSMSQWYAVVNTLFLNPASWFCAVFIFAWIQLSQSTLPSLVNPWDLPLHWWCAGYGGMRLLLFCFVDGSVWIIGPYLTTLPSRTGPKPVYQHQMGSLDYTYLCLNSSIEFIFLLQVTHLLWFSPLLVREVSGLGLLNTPFALWFLLVVDDMLYAPLHRALHLKFVYRYVHKHHHRNTFPARGYVDAANEHPTEQLAALTLHYVALHIVAYVTGLHVVAVLMHFVFKALGACFNHTEYDLSFSFAGLEYSVRAHEMHHRKPNINFGQYVMFWDRMMGTFRAYESGLASKDTTKHLEPALGTAQVLPSSDAVSTPPRRLFN